MPRKLKLTAVQYNIPIPEMCSARKWSHILDRLNKKGASLFFPKEELRSLTNAVSNYKRLKRNEGKNFTARTLIERKVKGIRVWRTS